MPQVVLVVGATGDLGTLITEALLADKDFETRILVRSESLKQKSEKVDQLKAKGAKVVEGDVEKPETLPSALKGVDIIVSSIAGLSGISGQKNLLEPAKAAGVKRIVPSEYGVDYFQFNPDFSPLLDAKLKFVQELKASGLEYTVIPIGFFMEGFFSGWYKLDVQGSKARIPGDGNAKVALTHTHDIAKLIPKILKNPKSKNAVVGIAGDRVTWNEAVALCEQVSGKKFEKTSISEEDLKKGYETATNFGTKISEQLVYIQAKGWGDIPNASNKDYDHKFTSVKEYLSSIIHKA